MKTQLNDTIVLLRGETFHKKEILYALKAAASHSADDVKQEAEIAEELYRRMLK